MGNFLGFHTKKETLFCGKDESETEFDSKLNFPYGGEIQIFHTFFVIQADCAPGKN